MYRRSTSEPRIARRTGRRQLLALALALPLLTLVGCSVQQATRPQGSLEQVRPGSRFAVGSVAADLTVVGDSRAILKESLEDALAVERIGCGGGSPSCYTVDARASLADPAAAFRTSTPPLRLAELTASLREPGSGIATAPIWVQHTVAVTGNLSTATWMRVSDALAAELASALAARNAQDAVSIHLPAWATHNEPLSHVSNVQPFQVAVVGDSRANRETIGSVTDGHVRPVRLARVPTEYLTEAITDELRAAGHTIVPAPDGRFVAAELSEFWIEAAPAQGSRNWIIDAHITLALEIAPPAGAKRRKAQTHSCARNATVAYAPGDTALTSVLEACLGDLMRSIRSDAGWSQ